ncbi:MAG: hypothetical protein MJY89_08085 [Bacteroidales bacterium]|nr:hypothetical protein [Bacteroidales bacterium]
MKILSVPFIPGLETQSAKEYSHTMLSAGASGSIDAVNWPEQYPYCPETTFWIARSNSHLALRYSVMGLDLRATALSDNGRSWEDSCCEFFVSAGSGEYFNVETTCIGSILMARGSGRSDRNVLATEDVARIIRRSSLEYKEYSMEGGPYGWTLDILIPFDMIGLSGDDLPSSVGANFYKCANLTPHPHFVSWNPVETEKPDFHRPEFFGRLEF